AINILQSVYLYIKNTNEKMIKGTHICKCLGILSNVMTHEIIEYFIQKSINESYDMINKIRNEHQTSIQDIITNITEILVNPEQKIIKKEIIPKILEKISEIEYNLLTCPESKIQIAAIISIFKLYGNM